jgi:hypothetical protein
MTAAALPVGNSHAALSPDNPIRREPRAPGRVRPDAFYRAFDRLTLFYDCFWAADGRRVLLVGPPPMNLRRPLLTARYRALPGTAMLRPRLHASLSTAITELREVPEDTTAIEIAVAGEQFVLPVQPSSVATLKGRRVLFSVNRDNELGWIREWAMWHATLHGTDAVILFDNGSSRYTPRDVLATLRSVPGLAHVGVPSWPYSFGPIDPRVRRDPYWARFLQIGSMSVLLRRYGEAAQGLLDCDVDELAGTRSGTSIYELATASRGGLAAFTGLWIEATAQGVRHRDYTERHRDPQAAASPRRKWVLDPTRDWVGALSVHPYWHWIEGRPWFSKAMPEDALYWHFRGINTNWKQARTAPPTGPTETEPLLAAGFQRLGP